MFAEVPLDNAPSANVDLRDVCDPYISMRPK
jgi:hypothetical protein